MELKLLELLVQLFHFLLIVPYGIETARQKMIELEERTFNRTLWN